jgi:FAD synthetase
MMTKQKKVMVFGVFDRLHEGHIYFLSQAKGYGEVIVVVARDKTAKDLKNRLPLQTEEERAVALEKLSNISQVVLGDEVQGSYEVIKKYKPDIICLGYDQDWLKKDLEEKMGEGLLPKIELTQATSHQPEELHSLLLNNR